AEPADRPGGVERPAARPRGDAAVVIGDEVDQRLAGDSDHPPGPQPVMGPPSLGAAGPGSAPAAPAGRSRVPVRAAPPRTRAHERWRHCGLRFSRNAFMFSRASGSWLVAAITSMAKAYALAWSRSICAYSACLPMPLLSAEPRVTRSSR